MHYPVLQDTIGDQTDTNKCDEDQGSINYFGTYDSPRLVPPRTSCYPINIKYMSNLNPGAFAFVPGQAFRIPRPAAPAAPAAPPPAPIERPEQTETPRPAPTISLNIGGARATPPPPPAAAPAPLSEQAQAPAPAAAQPPPPAAKDTAPSRPKDKFDFTASKAKTNADALLKEAQTLVDEDTLKDLYGDSAAVDPNGK
jgi:hypothetical protein